MGFAFSLELERRPSVAAGQLDNEHFTFCILVRLLSGQERCATWNDISGVRDKTAQVELEKATIVSP